VILFLLVNASQANNARKEKLLSVMTMATKIARSVAQQRGEENGGKGGGESTSGSGEAEVMTMVEAMWPRFPRAVRHTFRHCKPDTGVLASPSPCPKTLRIPTLLTGVVNSFDSYLYFYNKIPELCVPFPIYLGKLPTQCNSKSVTIYGG
jgi:hypothetical protein